MERGIASVAVLGAGMRTFLRLVFVATAVLYVSSCAHANRGLRPAVVNASAWPGVIGLAAGQAIEVVQYDGHRVTGVFVGATNFELRMDVNGTQRRLSPEDVRELVALGQRRLGRSVRRGFLAGAAAGAGINAITVKSERAPWIVMGAAGGGLIGALGGLLEGVGSRERTVVYQASMLPAALPTPPALLALIRATVGDAALDCGAGVDASKRDAIRHMTRCGIKAAEDRHAFFFAVWDISDDSARLWGLLGKQDGKIQRFVYDSSGDRFDLTPCAAPAVGATVVDFQCGPARALLEDSAFTFVRRR